MKKFLVILLSVLTLAVSVPMTANAMPILDSKNSVDVKGEISTLKKEGNGYKITVKVTEKGAWKNHYYSTHLTKFEMKSWKAEEGKISKGTKVWLWLYKNGTKKVNDDVFVNVRKRG